MPLGCTLGHCWQLLAFFPSMEISKQRFTDCCSRRVAILESASLAQAQFNSTAVSATLRPARRRNACFIPAWTCGLLINSWHEDALKTSSGLDRLVTHEGKDHRNDQQLENKNYSTLLMMKLRDRSIDQACHDQTDWAPNVSLDVPTWHQYVCMYIYIYIYVFI